MKIGILTFFESENYGTVLQAYALQRFLESCGHDVELLHIKRDVNGFSAHYKNPVTSYSVFDRLLYKIHTIFHRCDAANKTENFKRFRENYLHVSRFYETDEQLRNELPTYDACISGGDQIWNPYHKIFSKHYMFDFLPKEILRISYGSSFGVDNIEEVAILDDMKKCLSKYKALAVREASGVQILSSMGLSSIQVMDPVFLICDEWKRFVKRSPRRKKYCVVYGLIDYPKEEDTIVRRFAKANNLDVIILPENRRNVLAGYKTAFDVSPEEFLNLLANAECVFTNSFHGMAFSIIFQKQFFLLGCTSAEGIEKRGRLLDLLNVLEIGDRPLGKCDNRIDFRSVAPLLIKATKYSQDYLLKVLDII